MITNKLAYGQNDDDDDVRNRVRGIQALENSRPRKKELHFNDIKKLTVKCIFYYNYCANYYICSFYLTLIFSCGCYLNCIHFA